MHYAESEKAKLNKQSYLTLEQKVISKFICKYSIWVWTSNLDVCKQKLNAESK